MLILTIRTDKPEAEIGLFDGQAQLAIEWWQAHRQLAETIHTKIDALLKSHGKTVHDVQGIVCFKGPGSFTGLRIGLTVGNVMARSLKTPIVAEEEETWMRNGIKRLLRGETDKLALPEYGAPARTTTARK